MNRTNPDPIVVVLVAAAGIRFLIDGLIVSAQMDTGAGDAANTRPPGPNRPAERQA